MPVNGIYPRDQQTVKLNTFRDQSKGRTGLGIPALSPCLPCASR